MSCQRLTFAVLELECRATSEGTLQLVAEQQPRLHKPRLYPSLYRDRPNFCRVEQNGKPVQVVAQMCNVVL